jgi:hypothetical protein
MEEEIENEREAYKIITEKTDENDNYETKGTNPRSSRGLQGIMQEIHQ